MIFSEFVIRDNKIHSFSVKGHSDLAEAPHDVLCASVSAMTLLTINTVREVFQAEVSLNILEEIPLISMELLFVSPEKEEAVCGVLQGLLLQLKDLKEQYPSYLTVKINKEKKG